MIKVSEIVSKAIIEPDRHGFIASYEDFTAEGMTRDEALNNLIDAINFVERTWTNIKIRLFSDELRNSKNKRLFKEHKISVN